jgi:hypothetical protein
MRVTAVARRSTLAAALVAAALGAGRPARAAEVEVAADTALQAYEVTSPWGDVTLSRRRFMTSVGLAVYNLQGGYHPGEADWRIVVRVRIDADYGINANLPASQAGGETNYLAGSGGYGVRYIPGLQVAPVDVMYGYIEGRNLVHGLLGVRLGRQYLTDVLGFWAFDGGLFKLTTPYFVQVEAYGGLEERGGLPASTSRFEQQGVWRGSHQGFDTGAPSSPNSTDYPSFLYAQPAPAFGVAVESNGPSWIHSRFDYRHVYNTGAALTTQFPSPSDDGGYRQVSGTRTSQERLGWAGEMSKPDLGQVKGGFTYDLYNGWVGSWFGGAEAYLGKRVTLGADADYFVPVFDGDSIFNWFTHGPMTTLTGRVAIRPTRRLNITVSGGTRLWWAQGDPSNQPGGLSGYGESECQYISNAPTKATPAQPALNLTCKLGQVTVDPGSAPGLTYSTSVADRSTTTTVDAVANLNGRYHFPSGEVGFKGMVEAGARGQREGGDFSGEKRWDGGRYTTGARVSLYGWADPTRPDRDAVSFGYVLAGGFRPVDVASMRVEWEHDTNRLVGQRYRVMALLNVRVLK